MRIYPQRIILIIKEPLYSNIIMSIKFDKRFKHHKQAHSQLTFSPSYIMDLSTSQNTPYLTYRQNQNDWQNKNFTAHQQLFMQYFCKEQKVVGFFDFPTNISEFEEFHDELQISDSPSFSLLPSLSMNLAEDHCIQERNAA